MIKLNNKNITYVALADTNNSIKAPKEIWYADSNNSVKLVYRRKDALIEGEDYEKYHWLKGDGTTYINTLKPIESDSEVRCVIIPTSEDFNRWQYIYANDPSDIGSTFMCVLLKNNSTLHFRHKRGNVAFAINTEYECIHSIDSVKVNNEVLIPVSESEFQESNAPLYLFNAPTVSGTSDLLFDGYIKYVTLSDKLYLIPCKLLKPVPKWLDANGIRRQVGECGMIDLVSGKFYGNVNSVGTFTVENYYERKEWLQGRNGAYINTNHKLVTIEDRFDIKYRIVDGGISNEIDLFGYTDKAFPKARNVIFTAFTAGRTFANYCYATNSSGYFLEGLFDGTMQIYADTSNMHRIINGIELQVVSTNGLTQQQMGDVYLFDVNLDSHGNHPFNGDIAYFKITDTSSTKMNLIPCTLTMDLPASMDANNIARAKGTSGMWDLVSDRFYGNVANSGTFKAVNLAEGVDYEVHQWLVGDGNAYINTLITKFDGIVDISFYFSSYNGSIFGRERGDSSIEDYSDRFVVTINNNVTPNGRIYGKDANGAELSIANDERLIIDIDNGVATNKNGDTAIISVMANVTGRNLYLFADNYRNNPYNNKFNGRIGLFSISNKIYLIPCKLLKSIPSKYDANGIARQVGECGMYDTVNDVFYGNVASSGSFTVSND